MTILRVKWSEARAVKYTVIHLETFEMKVVEEISDEEVERWQAGVTVVVDMATGAELAVQGDAHSFALERKAA